MFPTLYIPEPSSSSTMIEDMAPTLSATRPRPPHLVCRDLGRRTRDSLDILDNSWATALGDATTFDERHIPHDVDEAESVWDDSDDSEEELCTPVSGVDAMILAFGFDPSCLNDLDEQLLISPVDSFADICWSEAVDDDRYPRPLPRRSLRSKANLGLIRSEDSDTDSSRTCHDLPESPVFDKVDGPAIALVEAHPHSFPTIYDTFDDAEPRSIVALKPHFSTSGPRDSIGFFPIPYSHRDKPRNGPVGRMATFCTKLIKLPS